MVATERIWAAFTSMIKLEEKLTCQNEVIKAQQSKIENLTRKLIRVETTLDLLMHASEFKRLK